MMRFAEMSPTRVGMVAILLTVASVLGGLSVGRIQDLLSGKAYSAAFAEASGLHEGADVRISGVKVGRVSTVELDGNHVKVSFSVDRELGDSSRASVKTATLLGTKFLSLESIGAETMNPGDQIPIERTASAYDVTAALGDLTSTVKEIDAPELAKSLDVLSEAFQSAPTNLKVVLGATERLARTIESRDSDLEALLSSAEGLSGILAERNADIITIMSKGNALVSALQRRRDTLVALVRNLRSVSTQVSALAREQMGKLRPALNALHRSTAVFNDNVENIEKTLTGASTFLSGLLEGISDGPFFNAYLAGIAPVELLPVVGDLLTSSHQTGAGR